MEVSISEGKGSAWKEINKEWQQHCDQEIREETEVKEREEEIGERRW